MSNIIQKVLLQTRSPLAQFQRFRGKIDIKRPRAPHYERARVIAVSQPIIKEPAKNLNCFQKRPSRHETFAENPYNVIIAREVLNWFDHSKMVGIFHLNSLNSDDIFKVRVALHKQNMHLKSYGKQIIKLAVENTRYEAILPLFYNNHCIVFSPEQKVATLLKLTRKIPQMILLAGIVENSLLSRNEFVNFAQLPNLTMAQAHLVNVLNMAGGQIVRNLEAHQNAFVNVLDVYTKSQESTQSATLSGDKSTSETPKE